MHQAVDLIDLVDPIAPTGATCAAAPDTVRPTREERLP
jgi:hypothetical protein